jgi:hypothetical protein
MITSKLPLMLVPTSLHGERLSSNDGKYIPVYLWKRITRYVYQQANYQCEVCGGVGEKWPVEAHEQYEYDDTKKIQRLASVIALCPLCHRIAHYWQTAKSASPRYIQRMIEHLRDINGWSDQQCLQYIIQETRICERRCHGQGYTVDFSLAKELTYTASFLPEWPSKGHNE